MGGRHRRSARGAEAATDYGGIDIAPRREQGKLGRTIGIARNRILFGGCTHTDRARDACRKTDGVTGPVIA